ncbi:hypothetical protein GTHT12_02840 [Geobacillus thermodenitrificans]|uniref:hypothetical protein n=1 Tax=Geobacillus thermodenitrificans TaxID=33940 RepID=UPI000A294A9B|nr:hypothetical protein [Geobacillus thermodenitrificans]ARP44336.1 hypothetical protein GTHT12_02840 [Geobacillus thermodenitrificans]
MLKDVLTWLFKRYEEQNLEYCILRNYKELPEKNIGNDIDILIDEKKIKENQVILKEMCDLFSLKCIRVAKRQYVHQYYFISTEKVDYSVLQLDFQFNGEWRGLIYLKGQDILKDRKKYKNFYIPCPEHEALISYFASLVWGGFVKERYSNSIAETVIKNKSKFFKLLKGITGKEIACNIIDLILIGEISETSKYASLIRKRLVFNSLFFNPRLISTVKRIFLFYWYEFKIRLNPPGFFLVLIGPDGCGKTTISEALLKTTSPYFKREFSSYFHWRPRILPELGQLFRKKKTESNNAIIQNPHAKKPNGFFGSLFRLCYFTVDFIIGYWIKFNLSLRKSGLLLVDRYYYDFFVDQKRYRMNISKRIVKILFTFVPKPDLVIYLDNTPENLYQRKKELSFDELKRQITCFKELKLITKNFKEVKTDKSLEETLSDVTEEIINTMIEKAKEKF